MLSGYDFGFIFEEFWMQALTDRNASEVPRNLGNESLEETHT